MVANHAYAPTVLYVAGALLLLQLLWYIYVNIRFAGEPPIVSGYIPFLGVAADFAKDSVTFLKKCQARYGDVFTLIVAGKRMTFIMAPEDIPLVYKERKKLDFGGATLQIELNAFGNNVVVSRKPDVEKLIHQWWRTGLLGKDPLSGLSASVLKHLTEELRNALPLKKNEQSPKCNLWDLLHPVIFNATTKTFYGSKNLDLEKLRQNFLEFDKSFPILAAGIPGSIAAPQALKARDRMANQLTNQSERKSEACMVVRNRHDLFSNHAEMSDMDTGRAHGTLVWASQANTLPAAFWAVVHTHQDAHVIDALRKEISSVIRSKKGFESWKLGEALPTFSVDDLKRMVRLESASMEALRLASDSLSMRAVQESMSMKLNTGTYSFRKGDRVMIAPRTLHKDSDIYENPETYVWDRYLDVEDGAAEGGGQAEQKVRLKSRFSKGENKSIPRTVAFMPFGGGVSMCPGRNMAMNEIKLLQILILTAYDVDIDAPPKLDLSRAGFGILSPMGDCHVRFTKL
eukprot:jgi/Bigna1/83950/fgenesh1_pg.119_\